MKTIIAMIMLAIIISRFSDNTKSSAAVEVKNITNEVNPDKVLWNFFACRSLEDFNVMVKLNKTDKKLFALSLAERLANNECATLSKGDEFYITFVPGGYIVPEFVTIRKKHDFLDDQMYTYFAVFKN